MGTLLVVSFVCEDQKRAEIPYIVSFLCVFYSGICS